MRSRLAEAKEHIARAAGFNRSLLVNAGAMMGTTVITSLLGVAFWLLAAHHFSPRTVGVAGAAVSAMTMLGFLATLGLGTLLMGELPRREDGHRSLLNAALTVTGLTGAVLGLAFALIAPLVAPNLGAINESWLSTAFFATGAGLTALAFVLDQALIGLLRGSLQLRRNMVFALGKLLALIPIAALVAHAGAVWIYSAWAGGIAFSLIVLVRFYARRNGDPLRPNFGLLREMRSSAISHHAFNLALQTPELILPVLVVGLVSASANASFYIAWMIAGFMVMVPLSLSTVLYAVASGNPSRLAERLRFTVGLSLAFGLIANLVLLPAASPLLGIFGHSYADQATTPLHILALGAFALVFKTHYVAIRRVQRRLGAALPIVWGGTILELVGGGVGAALGGLPGVAWGWLVAVCIEGLVMGGEVVRVVRPQREEPLRIVPARAELEPDPIASPGKA